jgi:predicted transcriptional regulator
MSVYQLSILWEFSNKDELMLGDLITECSLPLSVLMKCMKGLIDSGLLKKDEVKVAILDIFLP